MENEIVLYSSSSEKIKDSLISYKGGEKQKVIGEEMKRLTTILIELKRIDINKSIFSGIPLFGSYFDKIKKEHIENKYSDSKILIDELTTELSKKCSELKQDDKLLDSLIVSLRDDITKNKAVFESLKEKYETLTGKEYKEEDVIVIGENNEDPSDIDELEKNNTMIILAHSMSKALSLIKNQSVYLAQLSNIKTQNMTFIQSITTDIKNSVSSIATGIIVANHLNMRSELMEIANSCNDVAFDMTLKTAQAMKVQTDKYKDTLLNRPIDDKRLDEAIYLVKETYENFHNFASTEMPKILEDLTDKSKSIMQLVNMVETSNNVHQKLLSKSIK